MMRPSPSFIAGACNGFAWGHLYVGGYALLTPGWRLLGLGVALMAAGWRVPQFRCQRIAAERARLAGEREAGR